MAYTRSDLRIVNGGSKFGVLAMHEPVSPRNLGEKMKRWGQGAPAPGGTSWKCSVRQSGQMPWVKSAWEWLRM